MVSAATYRTLVRSSGWYDLVVTAGFATPWTFVMIQGALAALAVSLHLPGALPVMSPMLVLLANLLGSVVIVWSIIRIRDPQQKYGRYDAVARFLFAMWQIYAVVQGASVIILGFTVMEVLFGVLQVLPVKAEVGAE